MDASGLIIRLENRLNGLEAAKTKTLHEIDRLHAEAAHASEDVGKPFPKPTGSPRPAIECER